MTDEHECPVCGNICPYPTGPGKWQYKPYPAELHDRWFNCEIRVSTGEEDSDVPEGELLFYPEILPGDDGYEYKDEPHWWPSNARWRKIDG